MRAILEAMTRAIRLLFLGAFVAASASAQFVFTTPVDPEELFDDPPIGNVRSPAVRQDQLELFLEVFGDIHRATRANTTLPFKHPVRVPELSTIDSLEERPFLSSDALRIYFTRRPLSGGGPAQIFRASRQNVTTPFREAVPLGPDGPTPFHGFLGSLSGDERTVYLEYFPESGKGISEQTDIAVATRPNLQSRFGPWTPIESVNTSGLESGPFITRDNRTLFISRVLQGLQGAILSTSRADLGDPFPEPQFVAGVNSGNTSNRDPFVIHPGSRMYFVRDGKLVYSDRVLQATYVLEDGVATRGRELQFPIRMQTRERDASLFEFSFFFSPAAFEFVGAVPNERLGSTSLSATLATPALLAVTFQAAVPLKGGGVREEVLRVRLRVPEGAPLGNQGVGLAGEIKLNGVPLAEAPTARILIQAPPARPFTSLLQVR